MNKPEPRRGDTTKERAPQGPHKKGARHPTGRVIYGIMFLVEQGARCNKLDIFEHMIAKSTGKEMVWNQANTCGNAEMARTGYTHRNGIAESAPLRDLRTKKCITPGRSAPRTLKTYTATGVCILGPSR
jgi:hypothetical protein